MPVPLNSRYYGLPIFDARDEEGITRPTVAIYPPSPPPADTTVYHHLVTGVETIEYLAWRFYGSSIAWWRIAEANPRAFPLDLAPGTTVDIPSPGDVGQYQRTRRFSP